MNEQEMKENHKTVAIFCGWEPRKANKEFPNGYLHLKEEDEEEQFMVSEDTLMEELPYATDWNYLMAAWKKFCDDITDTYHGDDENLALGTIRSNIGPAIWDCNIDLAFKELIRGIELINKFNLQEHGS